MNARVLFVVALVFAAVARAEDAEESNLAGIETVEPTFLEETADAAGFPFTLSKKMQKTTVEPAYYGEDKSKPKKYVTPVYADPKPAKAKKNAPRVFTSHYFAPMPKLQNGKAVKVSKNKKNRSAVPFRATVETPLAHRMEKGFQNAELVNGRLPNKFDDPRQNMKKTKAPAPVASLLEAEAAEEVDTTEQMEAQEEANPSDMDMGDFADHAAVVVADPANFYDADHTAPTWADEEATAEEAEAFVEVADEAEEEEADEDEAEEEESDEDEAEDEEEADEESEEEEADEAEDESEDEEEADEESEEEEEADEADEEMVSAALVELADEVAEDDANEAEMDEMAQNEEAAKQIDMDATSDEAGMNESDSDEGSSDAEVDDDSEAEVDEDAAVEEAAEFASNEEAAALVQEDEEIDTLLSEIDAHVNSAADSDSEKGTPGSSIPAGMSWEEAQSARLDALEQQIAAEKASTRKVPVAVVASKAELNADANTQAPEYNEAAEEAEMVVPEMTAQAVLLEKIAQLKAMRRA